MSEKEKR